MSKDNLHFHDNSVRVNYPDHANMTVKEYKAPTDESIRLMEEMHDKVLKNIIVKVKVENNLINGECFCIETPYNIAEFKLIFKFKINDQEFAIERQISRFEIGWDDQCNITEVSLKIGNMAKAIMLWYALKMFSASVYEQITGTKPPEFLLK